MSRNDQDPRTVPLGLPLVVWLWFLFVARVDLLAHEGHQPLPTKGVQVDLERGHVTLSRQASDALGIATIEIGERTVAEQIDAYASVVSPWDGKAYASARISGRIAHLNVKPGDRVVRGDVLAELSSRELEALRSEYERSFNEWKLSSEILSMTRPAVKAGALPGQKLIEAENAVNQNRNAVEILRIKAKGLGISLNALESKPLPDLLYPIRAPIDGVIVHSNLDIGKQVEATEHLFELVNNEVLWGKIQLLEKDALRIRVGQEVDFQFIEKPNHVFTGRIQFVGASLEMPFLQGAAWSVLKASPIHETKTLPELKLDRISDVIQREASQLVPGMVGKAQVKLDQGRCLSIPESSIYSDGLQRYVFVEESSTKKGSEYQKRPIRIGRRSGRDGSVRQVEVKEGDIFPGDRIVVRGGHELSSLFFLGILKLNTIDRQRIGLRLETVSEHRLMTNLALPASTQVPPQGKRVVSSQLAGTIHSVHVHPGESVKPGDLLMELSSLELQDLQLELLKAHWDAALYRTRYERLQTLNQAAVSARLLAETLASSEQSEQRSLSLQRQLRSLGLDEADIGRVLSEQQIAERLPLRSTISGQVAHFSGTLGESIGANQPLMEIHNLDELWIEAYASPSESFQIATNATATVSLLSSPSQKIQAKVSRLGPILDATSRIRSIWLVPVPLPPSPTKEDDLGFFPWREKMLVTATIHRQEGPSVRAISNESIVREGLNAFVFVQTNQGAFERRRIITGQMDDRFTEIRSGLELGEQIVASGVSQMQTAFSSLR